MVNKVCYVCCVYFGNRRCAVKEYDLDRLSYVKEHVKSLQEVKHNLSRIIFIFNLNPEDLHYFEEAKKIIPPIIQRSPVEIIQRENYGMSYGAWSDAYVKYQDKFDYYVFNEDDYFFIQDDFDKYLVDKFNSFENVGYLCGMAMNPAPENKWVTHAGNSVGISSNKVLYQVYKKFGCLPHGKRKINDLEERYGTEEQLGQISQTYEIFKMGYNIFDIREDYACPHDMGPYLKDKFPGFDHFIDRYFHWNDRFLFVPAPIKFGHNVFYLDIIDSQYQKKRSCYIINFHFGPRMNPIEEYQSDRLCFLKKHIENLTSVPNNLDKIIFSINIEPFNYKYLNEAIKMVPKKIKNVDVELVVREDKGFSQGAFSDSFKRNRDNYDYFIFNEDDYFPVEKTWDEYLIRKYNELPNAGYLTAVKKDEDQERNLKIHTANCFGISSTQNLNKIWNRYGCLPHEKTNDPQRKQSSDYLFTHSFSEEGLKIYDIREEYRVSFANKETDSYDIWRFFWWNEKDLISPAIIYFDKTYSWWESWDPLYNRRTNL